MERTPKLDYFTEHQKVLAPAPAIDIHVFTIPGEGQFVFMANYNANGPRYSCAHLISHPSSVLFLPEYKVADTKFVIKYLGNIRRYKMHLILW